MYSNYSFIGYKTIYQKKKISRHKTSASEVSEQRLQHINLSQED